MTAPRVPQQRACAALFAPVFLAVIVGFFGPQWCYWLGLGAAGGVVAVMIVLLNVGSTRPLLRGAISALSLLVLLAAMIASFYDIAWVLTRSPVAAGVAGAVLGCVALGLFRRLARRGAPPSESVGRSAVASRRRTPSKVR